MERKIQRPHWPSPRNSRAKNIPAHRDTNQKGTPEHIFEQDLFGITQLIQVICVDDLDHLETYLDKLAKVILK